MDQEINYLLTVDAGSAYTDLRRLESSLMKIAGILQHIFGSSEFGQVISSIQRLISMIRSLQIVAHALQIARMSGGDPLSWLAFAATAGAVGTDIAVYVYDSV